MKRGLRCWGMNVTSRIWAAACIAAVGVALCACKTSRVPGNNSLAAIQVTNHTPVEIARAVSDVFKAAGFSNVPVPRSQEYRLEFERPGNAGDSLLYSDWSFQKPWYKARIRIYLEEERRYVVACDAFRVLGRGDPHFEEERRLGATSAKQYQQLLEQAAARLRP